MVGGPRAGLVDNGHLPIQFVRQPWRELQAKGGQQAAVIVGKQARRRSRLRDGPVVCPQQKKGLHCPGSHAGRLTGGDPVQGHGNGAHVVLGQRQLEELGELGQLHGCLVQQLGTLL